MRGASSLEVVSAGVGAGGSGVATPTMDWLDRGAGSTAIAGAGVGLPVAVVWAWGLNSSGQLGDGTTTTRDAPVPSSGLSGATVLAAGQSHSLAMIPSQQQQTLTYGYAKLYRLTNATAPSGTTTYTYDPLGNRLSKVLAGQTTAYSYDHADRIAAAGSVSYTLNANGNETARGTDSFGNDQANRLKSATVGASMGTYVYDGDGKRVSKTVGASLPAMWTT